MKTALVAGGTGLVGTELVKLLLHDASITSVIAVGRRPLEIQHEQLKNVVVNFDNLSAAYDQLKADYIFCCLGTTMKQAGSKEAFWKVDHDYPLELAKVTHSLGAQKYLLVSALGADRNSTFYYNQVKGKVEEAIAEVPFDEYHIFRPSLLLGPRKEERSGEDAAKKFYRWFDFLIPTKYKGVEASSVAKAMLHFAKSDDRGTHIHSSDEIRNFVV